MQQLATLVYAVIVYDLLGRLGVARLWATLVAAILVLDAWTIALSQRVLSETFFTLALVLVAWLAVQRRGASLILASGALLGRAACAIAAPILLYASAHAAVVGTFGLTDANGWFLYGRVAEFADCRRSHVPADSRFLCQASDDPTRKLGAAFYLWNPASPARRIPDGTVTEGPGYDPVYGRFAKAVIADQPGDYARTVAVDTARFFIPGQRSLSGSDDAITLPARPGEAFRDDPPTRARLLPGYSPPARPPAAALSAYARIGHLPRPILALATLLALSSVAVAIARPQRRRHIPETFLLLATGLVLVVGSAATSEFVLRYLVPAAPFLLAAGALATTNFTHRRPHTRQDADRRVRFDRRVR